MLLRRLEDDDRPVVAKLSVRSEQEAFVEPLPETLAATAMDRDNYVMEADGAVVGFFQIDSTSRTQCVPDCLELHEVCVDGSAQGQGHGRSFVEALPLFLRETYPGWDGVCLTVNCRNERAKRLYELGGFEATGELKEEGRSGPQFIMCRRL